MLQRRSIKHLLFTHCFGNNNFVINCRTVDLVDNCFSSLQKNSTPLDEMIALQYTTQRTKSTSSATLHFPRKRVIGVTQVQKQATSICRLLYVFGAPFSTHCFNCGYNTRVTHSYFFAQLVSANRISLVALKPMHIR